MKTNKQDLLQINNNNKLSSKQNNPRLTATNGEKQFNTSPSTTPSVKKRKLCDVDFFDGSSATTLDKGDKSNNGDNKRLSNVGKVLSSTDKENAKLGPPSRKKEKINLAKLKATKDGGNIPMLGRGLRNEKINFEEDFFNYDKYTGEDVAPTKISFGNENQLAETLGKPFVTSTGRKNSIQNASRAKVLFVL